MPNIHRALRMDIPHQSAHSSMRSRMVGAVQVKHQLPSASLLSLSPLVYWVFMNSCSFPIDF